LAEASVVATIVAANSDTGNNIGFVTDSIAQLEKMDSVAQLALADSVAQLKKISESQLDTGTNMVFVDKTAMGSDTISVFVPADSLNNITSENVPSKEPADSLIVRQQTDVTNSSVNNEMAKTDVAVNETSDTNSTVNNPFYKPADNNVQVSENAAAGKVVIVAEGDQAVKKSEVTNVVKDDCRDMISDNDFDKLKRKMFVQNDNNDMIQAALKSLSNKCIMTEQVKDSR
jgi:hypothetical protein